MPAGVTTWAAYRDLRDELLARLRDALPLDAVLLPLHGAMVAYGPDGQWIDDAEGDLIARVRTLVGPNTVIGVHIDLHCHLTQAMLDGCDTPSDATFVLRRLLERRVEGAAVAMMWDPIARHLARAAGAGARLTLRLGGKMGPASGDPLDLDVIVTTRRGQVLGLEPFTDFGITPDTHRILVVKSIQHFHAAFAPIAAEVVYMAAPGAVAPIMQQIPLVRVDPRKEPWVEDPFAEG